MDEASTADAVEPTAELSSIAAEPRRRRSSRRLWLVLALPLSLGLIAITLPPDQASETAVRLGDDSVATTTVPESSSSVPAPTTTVPATTLPPTTAPAVREMHVTAESGTLSIRGVIQPLPSLAGEIVEFTVEGRDAAGGVLAFGADFGDGTPTGMPAPPQVRCATATTAAPAESARSVVYRHAYRLPGVYRVTLAAAVGGCHRDGNTVEAVTEVVIAPGSVFSNGPETPVVTVAQSPAEGRPAGTSVLSVGLVDHDGFVKKVTISWGDGQTSVIDYPTADCYDPITRWPSTADTKTFEHAYAASGDHVVSVTAVSSGCDGLFEQTATASGTVTS